ncbi:MAG TPA: MBOAT family O-acyltransferase [Spirochaetota bacterium]|nr:MBOAT family O-acyltransferase [Spirochaetota bacterium]
MTFNTLGFAAFFILFFVFYYAFGKKYKIQNLLLLFGSYFFYGSWDVRFLFLIILSSNFDYLFAIIIDKNRLTLSQRVKTAMFLLLSGVFFILIQYKSVSFSFLPCSLAIDSDSIINPLGYKVLFFSAAGMISLNLLYEITRNWEEKRRRKLYVILSVVMNLSILGFFKYYNFFVDSFTDLLQAIFNYTADTWTLKIILPVGISFYIFKSISYTVDVYRKNMDSCAGLVDYSVYLAFFPQLLAGPIERAKNLISQLQHVRPPLTKDYIYEGVWLFTWGLYKKVAADNLAIVVNEIFGPYDILQAPVTVPEDGLRILIAVYAYTIQIYCDFSGYTDMARGIGRLLGFKTMLNFNLPYFSKTPQEFWRRWHISLSTWLRDYLYISLGGNRGGRGGLYLNLFLTMLLGGLWHGAAWTFVLWGAYHGILLVLYRIFDIGNDINERGVWGNFFHGFITFNLVAYGWLMFRAKNMTTITVFTLSIFTSPFPSPEALASLFTVLKFTWFLALFQVIQFFLKDLEPVRRWNWFLQLNVWLFIIMSILSFTGSKVQEFIYFAF